MNKPASNVLRVTARRVAKTAFAVTFASMIASPFALATVKDTDLQKDLFNSADFQLRKTLDENYRDIQVRYPVDKSAKHVFPPFFASRSLNVEKFPVVASIGPSLSPAMWREIHKLAILQHASYSSEMVLKGTLHRNSKRLGLRGAAETRPAHKSRHFQLRGYAAIAVPRLAAAGRWNKILRERADRYFVGACTMSRKLCRSKMFKALKTLRDRAQSLPPHQQLQAINRGVNRIVRYRSDWARHRVIDYWDQFREVVQKRSGDCEDISMVKYWLLASLGVSRQDMGLLLVRVNSRRADHAVLVVKTTNGQVYLDNRASRVKRSTEVPDYSPVAVISGAKTWIYGRRVASHTN